MNFWIHFAFDYCLANLRGCLINIFTAEQFNMSHEEQPIAKEHEKYTNFDEASLVHEEVLYQTEKIKITSKNIILQSYFFPFGLRKVIPLDHVKGFELRRNVGIMEMKTWGMAADFEVWWHMDFAKSFGERNAIIIDVGSWPKIGFCPGEGHLSACQEVEAILNKYCHGH